MKDNKKPRRRSRSRDRKRRSRSRDRSRRSRSREKSRRSRSRDRRSRDRKSKSRERRSRSRDRRSKSRDRSRKKRSRTPPKRKKSPKSKESRVISKWDDYDEASEGSKSPQIIEKDDEVLIGTETVKGRVLIFIDFSFRQRFINFQKIPIFSVDPDDSLGQRDWLLFYAVCPVPENQWWRKILKRRRKSLG